MEASDVCRRERGEERGDEALKGRVFWFCFFLRSFFFNFEIWFGESGELTRAFTR